MLRLTPLLLLLATLVACSGPIPDELTGQCDDLTIAEEQHFDDVILPDFFDVHCVVCHDSDLLPEGQGPGTRRGASRSFDYNTYDAAVSSPEATWSRIADRTMPPMGREVNEDEAATIREWLNCLIAKEAADGDDDDSSR
jgi:mono/diheme cytochrome c family protein